MFLRNQTVLLKGVNDDPAVLGELFRGLTRVGVAPYYVFQCRPVKGVMGHFQVPINRGVEIVRDAKAMQNAWGNQRAYAMSHPRGKIEIVGKTEDGQVLFHFTSANIPRRTPAGFLPPAWRMTSAGWTTRSTEFKMPASRLRLAFASW